MLIDPWDVIKGTLWLLVGIVFIHLAALYLAVKLLIWAYHGSAWTVARCQARHLRRIEHA